MGGESGGEKMKQEQNKTCPKRGDKNLFERCKQNKPFKKEGPIVMKGQNAEEPGTGVSGRMWVYVGV